MDHNILLKKQAENYLKILVFVTLKKTKMKPGSYHIHNVLGGILNNYIKPKIWNFCHIKTNTKMIAKYHSSSSGISQKRNNSTRVKDIQSLSKRISFLNFLVLGTESTIGSQICGKISIKGRHF